MGGLHFATELLSGRRSPGDACRAVARKMRSPRRYIHLEITARCNIRCKACYRSGPLREHMDLTSMMSVEQVSSVLTAYSPSDVGGIALSGAESVLHPEFVTVVEMARDRFPDQDLSMWTNGLALSKDSRLLDSVCSLPLDSIGFSLHAATQSTLSRLQPGLSLADNVRTMTHVAENSGAAVSVQYVIQEENVDELVSFVELVAETPVKSVGFTPMNFAGHQEGAVDYEGLWRRIGLRQKWEAAAHRGTELGIDVLTLRDRCLCTDNIDVIAADGSLLPCWGNYLVKKYAVGNVFHENPDDIRRKPAYRAWREGLRTGRLPEMCSACWIRGYDL